MTFAQATSRSAFTHGRSQHLCFKNVISAALIKILRTTFGFDGIDLGQLIVFLSRLSILCTISEFRNSCYFL